MEVIELLKDLAAMGEEGEKWYRVLFPFLWGKTILDAEELYDIVTRLEKSLPDELTTANQVARDREKIVREAHEERAKILESAREQAQLLISNDELVKQAERKRDEILNEARVEADAIRAEAEAWARGVIERLQNYMTRTQSTLDKAKTALAAPAVPTPRGTETRVIQDGD
jgi:vacuolar-type H+-ATPase subunit H